MKLNKFFISSICIVSVLFSVLPLNVTVSWHLNCFELFPFNQRIFFWHVTLQIIYHPFIYRLYMIRKNIKLWLFWSMQRKTYLYELQKAKGILPPFRNVGCLFLWQQFQQTSEALQSKTIFKHVHFYLLLIYHLFDFSCREYLHFFRNKT